MSSHTAASTFFLLLRINLQKRDSCKHVRIDRDRRWKKKSQGGVIIVVIQHEMALQLLVDSKHLEIQATRTTRTLLFGAQRLVMG